MFVFVITCLCGGGVVFPCVVVLCVFVRLHVFVFMCLRACVRLCVCAIVALCVCVCVRVCVCAWWCCMLC